MQPMLDQTTGRCAMPPSNRTNKGRNLTGRFLAAKSNKNQIQGEAHMGMVMVKCPQTGRAIPTGIETDRESFRRSPVFFARTRCTICHTDHAWFAPEAWVDEFSARARRGSAGSLA
jgi:hypothetical protein